MATRSHRHTGRLRPRARALSDAPVEIDGMDVLFDKRVTLFPVTLVEKPARRAPSPYRGKQGNGNGHGNGHQNGHANGHANDNGHSHAHGHRRR